MSSPIDDALPPLPRRALRAPARALALLELRAVLDFTRMWPALLARTEPSRQKRQIIVLPGFGAGDAATWPLRRYLSKLGHDVEGWGLGVNRAGIEIKHEFEDLPGTWRGEPPARGYRAEGSVPMLCERMLARVRKRHKERGGCFTLIGWSLGGVIAREVARELPAVIDQVITMGTPVQGGPKYTAAASFFRNRGMDLDWIEREISRRESRPIKVPIMAIVSPSDGVVGFEAAHDDRHPHAVHQELDAAHLGMCMNPDVWRLIHACLERHSP